MLHEISLALCGNTEGSMAGHIVTPYTLEYMQSGRWGVEVDKRLGAEVGVVGQALEGEVVGRLAEAAP